MFIVIEIQKNETAALLNWTFDTRSEAEAKYHTILAAAAVSNVPKHGASLIDENGEVLKHENYSHVTEEE